MADSGARLRNGPAAFAAELERARRHCETSEFAAAERLCRQILEKAPGFPHAALMLGRVLSTLGRHEEAIAMLASLATQYSDAGSAHFALGNALHAAGRYAAAADHLRRAAELQPQFAGARCNLGLVLERLGDMAGAIGAYESALALDANLVAAHVNLGVALLNDDKPDRAVTHLRRAAELGRPTAANDCLLGRAFQALGKNDEALACYEQAVAEELPRDRRMARKGRGPAGDRPF